MDKTEIDKKAQEIWEKMNDSERFGVSFGLFPARLMDVAGPDQHELVVALMKIK